ncbi:MAG: galactokinase [Candidatus Neomarinimicrobiota bacterium]
MRSLEKLIRENERVFAEHFGGNPACTSTAPGRINIIGEHTDYTMGLAMPAAIDRWILVSIAPRRDRICRIVSRDFHSEMTFELGGEFIPSENWQAYVFGAASVAHDLSELPTGFQGVISGNIPVGSGLSSSGALEVALMNGIRSVFSLDFDDLTLIRLCQRVEHEFIDVQSGLLDQFASQFSRDDELVVIDFDTLTFEHFEADMGEYRWIVLDTGVKREIAQTEYMERVRECERGLSELQESGFPLSGFRDITGDHLSYLTGKTQKRIRHFLNENSRVLKVRQLILEKDFGGVGALLAESHRSLREDYEVSCDELDFLVEKALDHSDCAGGRMMGGGFGGCTLNLVRNSAIGQFMENLKEQFYVRFSQEPKSYVFNLVSGARVWWNSQADERH